jgi:hypothetical protein
MLVLSIIFSFSMYRLGEAQLFKLSLGLEKHLRWLFINHLTYVCRGTLHYMGKELAAAGFYHG